MPRGKKGSGMSKEARESKLLGDEFCSFVDGATEEALRKSLEQLPLDLINLEERKKGDADYQDARQRLATAGEQYTQGRKRILLKAKRIRTRLQGMGKPVGADEEMADKKLPAGAFDRLGGKKEDALKKPAQAN